jgi:hypothetical protein
VDLLVLLEKNSLHLPTDAAIHAVALVGHQYHPNFNLERVVVTVHNYHNLEVTLVFDDNGKLLSSILHRIYYRYSFFETYN